MSAVSVKVVMSASDLLLNAGQLNVNRQVSATVFRVSG
jgi:hypothetical protein